MPRRRSRSPSATTGSFAALGIHPHEAGEPTRDGSTSCASCSRTRTRGRGRRDRARLLPRLRAARPPATRSSSAQLELAAELGKPVVIHTRAADDDTLAALAGFDGTVVLHCFSSPRAARAGARARLLRLVRRQRHVPERARAARPRRARPGRRHPRRDRQPVPRAAAAARPAERAGERRPHRRRARRGRGEDADELAAQIDANADALPSACRERVGAEEGARPALPRRREHPRRDRAARRARPARRRARDRPGARRPHALPRRPRRARPRRRARPLARAAPRERSATATTSTLHFGDALALDLARARARRRASSSRTCRTTSRRRSSSRASTACPSVELWCVMVQREVADRFFADAADEGVRRASPCSSSSRPSAPGFHPVSRTVFRPRPNVDSALVAFRRTRAAAELRARSSESSRPAFAHRRKTLPNSLAARRRRVARTRRRPRSPRIGREPDARAEALAPRGVRRARARRCD